MLTKITWAIDRIPTHKAHGPEGVENHTWKTTTGRDKIRTLVRHSWGTASFPDESLRTTLIGLPKPNSDDTRGIALMNFLVKVIMGIIVGFGQHTVNVIVAANNEQLEMQGPGLVKDPRERPS